MRSSLTRNVFRAIIANEPYCVSAPTVGRLQLRRRPRNQPVLPSFQRRPLFGFSSRPKARTGLEKRLTPFTAQKDAEVISRFVRARRDQTQLPPLQEIVQAFNHILQHRAETATGLSRSEVYLLTEAFSSIREHNANVEEGTAVLFSDSELQQGLSALAFSTGKDRFRNDIKKLAYLLFSELRGRIGVATGATSTGTVPRPIAESYITVLSSTGGAREAWEILQKSSEGDAQKYWLEVVKGLSTEGLHQDAWKAFTEMKARTGDVTVKGHEALTTHFINTANIGATKKIYEQPLAEGKLPTVASMVAVVRFCIKSKELSWAQSIVSHLRSVREDNRVWDAILVFSAAQGTAPNDIATMIDEFAEIARLKNAPMPTMSNVNSIIEYAYSVGNLHAVQEYIRIAEERGLQPDAKTVLLQLDHEVLSGDLRRAESTYDIFSSEDPITDGSDIPVWNRFLRALCSSASPNYDLLMRVLESVVERDMHLDAETMSGLCTIFLQREELEEAFALLRDRVDLYSADERLHISQAFVVLITDPNVGGQRAFNAYELFRAAFPETPVEDRLCIMHSFFDRKRPDSACLVFGHMRQREDEAARLTPEAYGQCFEGIAKCQDIDGLQMVYNMLKLDLEVDPTTRVRNGLMAAYTACGEPFTAIIDHFSKIMNSMEGPTMSSFALALRSCETWVPQGAVEARKIIALMQSWELDITKEIYDCYVGAIAGQCEFENAVELIEVMETDIGVAPDACTIGTFYNAIPWQYRKDEVEAWAKQAYPLLWEALLTYGEDIDEDFEIRYFKIDRTIDTSDEPIFGDGEYHPEIAGSTRGLLMTPSTPSV